MSLPKPHEQEDQVTLALHELLAGSPAPHRVHCRTHRRGESVP